MEGWPPPARADRAAAAELASRAVWPYLRTVILYHYWRSSSSWRVRWALAIKGLAFEAVAVDLLAGEQGRAEHLRRNPIGHVPALVVGDRALGESVAIVEYLEAIAPAPPLYPADPWARARVRQLVELVASAIQPMQNLAVLRRHAQDPDEQRAWAAHWNARGLAAYESLLAQIAVEQGGASRFSVGDALTAADVFLVPQVHSARRFRVDLSAYPRVLAVEAAALATEHADAARPERQPGAPAETPP